MKDTTKPIQTIITSNTYIDSVTLNSNIQLQYTLEKYAEATGLKAKTYKKSEYSRTIGYEDNNKNIFTYSYGPKYKKLNFHGLKSYNEDIDNIKETKLYELIEYLNKEIKNIKLNIGKLDIALDINDEYNKFILTRRKAKKPNKQDTSLLSNLYRAERNQSNIVSGLLYNKIYKENELKERDTIFNDEHVTRLEIQLKNKLKDIKTKEDLHKSIEIYKLYKFKTSSTTQRNKRILNNNGKIKENSTTEIINFNKKDIDRFIDNMELVGIYL